MGKLTGPNSLYRQKRSYAVRITQAAKDHIVARAKARGLSQADWLEDLIRSDATGLIVRIDAEASAAIGSGAHELSMSRDEYVHWMMTGTIEETE